VLRILIDVINVRINTAATWSLLIIWI